MVKEAIRTVNLSKRYGTKNVVNNLNLSIKPGEIVGFLGLNGAGKTTTMRMMLGLIKSTSGECYIQGKKLDLNNLELRNEIGYIIETPYSYPDLTVRENLEIVSKLRGGNKDNIDWVIEKLKLKQYEHKEVKHLSLGNVARLGIAKAIIHKPKILILDEPTNGLDPIGIAEVRNFIKDLSVKKGKTILISSHILSEITLLADTVGIIDKGILLEESSMEELNKKNRKYIILEVSDVSKSATILEKEFGITNYSVEDNNHIIIYSHGLDLAKINKSLVMSGISVASSQTCNDSLEDYFKKITGGEGIA